MSRPVFTSYLFHGSHPNYGASAAWLTIDSQEAAETIHDAFIGAAKICKLSVCITKETELVIAATAAAKLRPYLSNDTEFSIVEGGRILMTVMAEMTKEDIAAKLAVGRLNGALKRAAEPNIPDSNGTMRMAAVKLKQFI